MNSPGADTGSNRSIEFLAWLEVNKRRLAIGAGVMAVIAAGMAVYSWYQNEREMAASAALLKVQLAASVDPAKKGPSAAELEKVATEYAGTAAGARALLFEGVTLYGEERYADAKAAFDRAIPLLRSESLAAIAAFGAAGSLDAMGKTAEAQAAYNDVILRYAGHAVATQARLVLGGLQEEKGELRQALQTYSQLTNALMSSWGSEAMLRRESLLAKHPELAATNAPVMPIPAGAPVAAPKS
jgi:predicted negative regulator of RcsB-dependent stress response